MGRTRITLDDEKRSYRITKVVTQRKNENETTFTADNVKSRMKIIVSVAPPNQNLIRMGGDYEIEATGKVQLAEASSNTDPNVRTYESKMLLRGGPISRRRHGDRIGRFPRHVDGVRSGESDIHNPDRNVPIFAAASAGVRPGQFRRTEHDRVSGTAAVKPSQVRGLYGHPRDHVRCFLKWPRVRSHASLAASAS